MLPYLKHFWSFWERFYESLQLSRKSNESRANTFGQTDGREGASRRYFATVRKRLKFKTHQSEENRHMLNKRLSDTPV